MFVCCPAEHVTSRRVLAQGPIQRFAGHRSDWPAGEPVPGGLFPVPWLPFHHQPGVSAVPPEGVKPPSLLCDPGWVV